jgi:hypothetical protein
MGKADSLRPPEVMLLVHTVMPGGPSLLHICLIRLSAWCCPVRAQSAPAAAGRRAAVLGAAVPTRVRPIRAPVPSRPHAPSAHPPRRAALNGSSTGAAATAPGADALARYLWGLDHALSACLRAVGMADDHVAASLVGDTSQMLPKEEAVVFAALQLKAQFVGYYHRACMGGAATAAGACSSGAGPPEAGADSPRGSSTAASTVLPSCIHRMPLRLHLAKGPRTWP